jgi:TonB family protein
MIVDDGDMGVESKKILFAVGRRLLFSLLAIWVHLATLFFVTMVLFSKEHDADAENPASNPHAGAIQVSLRAPPPPLPPPPQSTPSGETPVAAAPVPAPKRPTEEAAGESQKSVDPNGVLNCDALTKKPKLIASGEANMQTSGIDKIQGHIVLNVKIHRDGTVIDASVEQSTMTPSMEEQVLNSARHSIFTPGEIGGVAVDCDMRFEVSVDAQQ